MFNFLKNKLKGAISKLGKKAEEEAAEEIEESVEEKDQEIKKLEKEKQNLEEEEKKIDEELKKEKEKKKKEKSAEEKEKEKKEKGAEEEKEKKEKKKSQKEDKQKSAEKKETKTEQKPAEKEKESEEEKLKEESPEKEKKEIYSQKERKKTEEKKIEEKSEEAPKEKPAEKEKESEEEKIEKLEEKKKDIQKEEKIIEKVEEIVEKEKKGLFSKLREKITKTKVSEESFEKLFWELEIVLLENGVAVEVIEKIKNDLKISIVENPVPRGKIESTISNTLKNSIKEVLSVKEIDILTEIKNKKGPFVMCFIGINGSGKTTSIAKMARYFQDKGLSCVLAAADTFRAAAIDQLQLHAEKLGVKLIKHEYGSDAAAVAFDAIKHAESKSADVVLIDTAGRIHSNTNLMDEMKKIIRVADPDLKVFVGESIVGNDCIEQAKNFNESVGIDGIILSKADVDEKGGAAISISYVTKKPILFLGIGQEYKDLKPFNPEIVLESLGL